MKKPSYDIFLKELDVAKLQHIEARWRDLQKHSSTAHFFNTWVWIENVIASKPQGAFLVEARSESEIVGLGLLYRSDAHPKRWYLNKTGEHALDQAWIEYNDFLLHEEHSSELRSAILSFLFTKAQPKVRSLDIDMTIMTQEAIKGQGFLVSHLMKVPSYKVKLPNDPRLEAVLGHCSKNTKQQIKRSIKLLEQEGELSISLLDSIAQKNDAMHQIAQLHISQWRQSDWGSGFDNGTFETFHQNLVKHPDCKVLILKLNNKALAYGYYFCFNKRVMFYLSAITKSPDNRIKVGMVLHALAKREFSLLGYIEYDFLAGEARYKKSLSDEQYWMHSFRLYKTSVRNFFVTKLRHYKHLITSLLEEKR